ncbi:MAG: protein-L-isoaspartate O-methyltransferase [Sedimentisphaerales bacterium]
MTEKQNENEFDVLRQRMLRYDLKERGITNPRLLSIMAELPREEFVPNPYRSQAYKDAPLPIGLEQTISQPYIVALMTQELHISKDCIVLEIGTGSGYQTAILASLARRVYFDRIMVTAAVPNIPQPLINQLADGGLMVIPVGYTGVQELILCERRGEKIIETSICDVRFVKLFGKYGFEP